MTSNYFWQYIVANFLCYPIRPRVTKASALELTFNISIHRVACQGNNLCTSLCQQEEGPLVNNSTWQTDKWAITDQMACSPKVPAISHLGLLEPWDIFHQGEHLQIYRRVYLVMYPKVKVTRHSHRMYKINNNTIKVLLTCKVRVLLESFLSMYDHL